MSDVRDYAKEVSDWVDGVMEYLEKIDITDSSVLSNIERLSQLTKDMDEEEMDYEDMVLIEEEMARVYEEIEELAREFNIQDRQSVPIGKIHFRRYLMPMMRWNRRFQGRSCICTMISIIKHMSMG